MGVINQLSQLWQHATKYDFIARNNGDIPRSNHKACQTSPVESTVDDWIRREQTAQTVLAALATREEIICDHLFWLVVYIYLPL